VTRERLPQRAGSPGLNGGGTAAAVPPPPNATQYRSLTANNWTATARTQPSQALTKKIVTTITTL